MQKITVWKSGSLKYDGPKVMGIVNVTPDSFSDGGVFAGREAEHALRLIDDGADIIDVGGESTRPNYVPVSVEEEISRVVPVIRRISESTSIPISVDTMKPEVAEAALDAGADIINDINGLRDERMIDLIASAGAATVIMHMPFDPINVHKDSMVGPPIPQIVDYLSERVEKALDGGIGADSIILDPGIGFGKTNMQNINILEDLTYLGNRFPILIGASRKRFLSEAYPLLSKEEASIEAARLAISNGASIVRVHDVKNTVRMLKFTGTSV